MCGVHFEDVQSVPIMSYHSQSLGRSLSVTSLEGIQVRLGERFRLPEKVSLPLGYREPNPSATLNESQFSYETESTFLRWLGAKKASDAAKETSKQEAREERRAAATSPVQLQNEILQPTNAKPGPSELKNHSIPQMASLGGDIMTPVPLDTNSSSGRLSAVTQNPKQSFDLADFENNASDPFESTELETLNDLEELKSVLAFTNVPAQPGAVTTEQPLHSPDLSIEVDSTPTELIETAAISIHASNKQVAYKPNKPKLKPKTLSTSPTGVNGPTAIVPNGQPVLPITSHIPVANQNPFVRSPLPPINSPESDSVPATSPADGSVRLIARGPVENHSPQPSRGRSPPPGYYAQDFTQSGPSPTVSPIEPPPSYPQNLSRYTPLPPSPHMSRTNSMDHGQTSPLDPVFDMMGAEDRNFVLTIASMGFPRSRTARAVKQLGHDDRLVVEWLCAVDFLCSRGFQEHEVELALSLQDNDTQKAQEFLLLIQRFEELGFKSEDIRRELIVHGNNSDTVLNVLTKS